MVSCLDTAKTPSCLPQPVSKPMTEGPSELMALTVSLPPYSNLQGSYWVLSECLSLP